MVTYPCVIHIEPFGFNMVDVFLYLLTLFQCLRRVHSQEDVRAGFANGGRDFRGNLFAQPFGCRFSVSQDQCV